MWTPNAMRALVPLVLSYLLSTTSKFERAASWCGHASAFSVTWTSWSGIAFLTVIHPFSLEGPCT